MEWCPCTDSTKPSEVRQGRNSSGRAFIFSSSAIGAVNTEHIVHKLLIRIFTTSFKNIKTFSRFAIQYEHNVCYSI